MPALSTTSRRSTKHPHVLARAAGNLKLPIVERVDRSFDVVRALKVYLRAPPSIAIDERARVRHPSRASKRVLHVSPIRASRQILHLHRMLRLSRRRALPHRRSRVRAIAPSRSIVRPLSIASHPSRVSIAPVAVVPVAAVPVAARLPALSLSLSLSLPPSRRPRASSARTRLPSNVVPSSARAARSASRASSNVTNANAGGCRGRLTSTRATTPCAANRRSTSRDDASSGRFPTYTARPRASASVDIDRRRRDSM